MRNKNRKNVGYSIFIITFVLSKRKITDNFSYIL